MHAHPHAPARPDAHPPSPPPSRRQFLTRSALGTLVLSLGEGCGALQETRSDSPRFDLVVRGGRVIDPSQGLSAVRDVGIVGSHVAAVAQSIPSAQARRVLDARGRLVTPGLIDVHVHVYDGVAPLGLPADPHCISKGVTTVLDAGSAGGHTFPGFLRQIQVSQTRIFALLNISGIGQASMSPDSPYGELLELRYADPKVAIRTIEEHRDVILGIKIRLSRPIAGDHDREALEIAREAAQAVQLPLMVHIQDTHMSLGDILARLRKGDVVTHTFHGHAGGILDPQGRVVPEVRAAVARGVHLDVGHGMGSFSFEVAEKAIQQDLLPGTISSDLHRWNVNGPVFDLATTLSKFLHLGLSLEQVIERATSNAAGAFGFPKGLGTLREGAEADLAVWSLAEGDFELVDSMGAKRVGHQKLLPLATVKAGRVWG